MCSLEQFVIEIQDQPGQSFGHICSAKKCCGIAYGLTCVCVYICYNNDDSTSKTTILELLLAGYKHFKNSRLVIGSC